MILDFIKEFRERFGSDFFLNGGCYIFARILQVKFGGTIYSNTDHIVLNKEGLYYDITGIVEGDYSIIDPLEELRYINFHNFQ